MELLEDDVLIVYSMPPYRIGKTVVGRLGGSTIKESTQIYLNSVIKPIQESLENMMNYQILPTMKIESYDFKLNAIDMRDIDAEVERHNKMISHGQMTPNMAITRAGGLETYKDGDKYYMTSTLKEIGAEGLEKKDNERIQLISEIAELRKKLETGDYLEGDVEEFLKRLEDNHDHDHIL